MVVQEAKAKELNDKVVTEATVAVATTGDAVQLAQKETRKFCLFHIPSAQNSSTTIENKLVKLTIANKGDILLKLL
jgi:YidC/Oxa1 family membrane protein insertase